MKKSCSVQSALWNFNAEVDKGNRDVGKSYFELVKEELSIYGLDNAGVKELLALIMGTKADSSICQQLALLPLDRLLSMCANELKKYGVTASVAVRLEATFHLFRKLRAQKSSDVSCINSPRDVVESLSSIANEEQEHFVILLLNTKNHIKKTVVVSKGTVNSTLVHPREVFKVAIREGANAIILGHNHPSGDTTPSSQDIEITRRLSEVGATIGIEVLDHIIVGSKGYRSLKEMGLI